MKEKPLRSIYRNLVVGIDIKIPLADGSWTTSINFDNAATTPPFISVMNEIYNFAPWYSSIHRGTGYKSLISSDLYEKSRLTVMNFVGADLHEDTVVYVKNTTEAINKLSYRLMGNKKDAVILSSYMEHHSNDLPWRKKYEVDYIEIDEWGRIRLESIEEKLKKYKGRVKLVALTGASNVTGYVNPIYKAAEIAHKYGAEILIDGAQLVPHQKVDMNSHSSNQHIDYLAFSAHKMYAPFGTGVLIGHKKIFKGGDPEYSGGGTIRIVTPNYVMWEDPPEKEEAGTPNLMGVIALVASIKTLKKIGMNNIENYETTILKYAVSKLKNIPDIELYCNPDNCSAKVGIIPFNIKGIHHSIVAQILSAEAGIAVRNGCFCAQPYIQKLLSVSKDEIKSYIKNNNAPRQGMVRLSFGLYNDCREIDVLINMLTKIALNKDMYLKKYQAAH